MKKIFLHLIFVLTVLCATSSFAQTLINQSNISSFPYVISTPGSYKLSSNITVSSTGVDAFNIEATGVTLDLGGYTISGPMSCTSSSCTNTSSSIGIYAYQGGATVQNGFIKGFNVCLEQSTGVAQNLNVLSCSYGIYANQVMVRANTASNCLNAGIYAFNSVVSDNGAFSNGGYGILAYQSSAINNSSLYNVVYGLYIDSGPYTGNTIFGNGTDVVAYGSAVSSKINSCTSAAC
jgi:hypothetical protein